MMEEIIGCINCLDGDMCIESSREMQITQISCVDCGEEREYELPEEDAISKYNDEVINKFMRKSMIKKRIEMMAGSQYTEDVETPMGMNIFIIKKYIKYLEEKLFDVEMMIKMADDGEV